MERQLRIEQILQETRPPMVIKRDWLFIEPEEEEAEGIHIIR